MGRKEKTSSTAVAVDQMAKKRIVKKPKSNDVQSTKLIRKKTEKSEKDKPYEEQSTLSSVSDNSTGSNSLIVDAKKTDNFTAVTSTAKCPKQFTSSELKTNEIQSDISQRPRRQIQHKFIKTGRNSAGGKLIEENVKIQSTSGKKMSSKETDDDNSSVDECFVEKRVKQKSKSKKYSNPSSEENLTKDKEKGKMRRSNRQKKVNDGEDKEQIGKSDSTGNITLANEDDDDDDVVQIVEIVDADEDDVLEEIVETTSAGTNEQYEYYYVEDSNEEMAVNELISGAETNETNEEDSKHTYVVTIEDDSSDSQYSQGSICGKQIYVEVTESLDSQEIVEVVTTYDSNSQSSTIQYDIAKEDKKGVETNVSNKRNSFEGVLSGVDQEKNPNATVECQKTKEIETDAMVQEQKAKFVEMESNIVQKETADFVEKESDVPTQKINNENQEESAVVQTNIVNVDKEKANEDIRSGELDQQIDKVKDDSNRDIKPPANDFQKSQSDEKPIFSEISEVKSTPKPISKKPFQLIPTRRLTRLSSMVLNLTDADLAGPLPTKKERKKKNLRDSPQIKETIESCTTAPKLSDNESSSSSNIESIVHSSPTTTKDGKTDKKVVKSHDLLEVNTLASTRSDEINDDIASLLRKEMTKIKLDKPETSKNQTEVEKSGTLADLSSQSKKEDKLTTSDENAITGKEKSKLLNQSKKQEEDEIQCIQSKISDQSEPNLTSNEPKLTSFELSNLKPESIDFTGDELKEIIDFHEKTENTDCSSVEKSPSSVKDKKQKKSKQVTENNDKQKSEDTEETEKPKKGRKPKVLMKHHSVSEVSPSVKCESKKSKVKFSDMDKDENKKSGKKVKEQKIPKPTEGSGKSKAKKSELNETPAKDSTGDNTKLTDQQLALELLSKLDQTCSKQKKKITSNSNKPQSDSLPTDHPPRVKTPAEKKDYKMPKEKSKKKVTIQEHEADSNDGKKATKSKKKSTEMDEKNDNRKNVLELTETSTPTQHPASIQTEDKPKLSTNSKKNRTSTSNESKTEGILDTKPDPSVNTYSILSDCYLPKMVKYDESLYSIEALKAAQLAAEKSANEAAQSVIPIRTYATRPPKQTETKDSKELIDENYFLTDYKDAQIETVDEKSDTNRQAIVEIDRNVEKVKKKDKEVKVKSESNAASPNAEEETNIRRSGRIKTKIESNQRSHGYGLVKDKEKYMYASDISYASMMAMSQDQSYAISDNSNSSSMFDMREELMQYFEPRVKSSEELEKERKDIEDGHNLFTQIVENEYKCERIINKESRKMTCDCFLTKSEIERGELGCGEDCLNRLLMIECGNRCVVGDRCTNKRFQKVQNSDCAIFKTEKKGFGMKATSMIPAGEFIMEYVGEVLNNDQFEKRADEYCRDNNKHFYFMALRSDCVIDATSRGNISRFINHSCDPNAETQKWTVNGELRIGFFSKKNIYPDQEITFDYQFQRYGKEAQKCYCEAECCRGWIGEEPESDDEYEEEEVEDEEEEIVEEIDEIGKDISEVITSESIPDKEIKTELEEKPITEDIDQSELKLETEKPEEEEELTTKSEIASPIKVTRVVKVKKEKVPIEKLFKRIKAKRSEIYDDPDLDKEINILTRTNLKNQAHTLQFSRLMVRAKQQLARSQLLYLLRNGELACRRLFLDYHGLKLLYNWMCDSVSTNMTIEWGFRLEIMQTLEVLPIPNKTMLQDSKVLAMIKKWSTATSSVKETSKSPDESPSNSGSATPISEDNVSPKADDNSVKETMEKPPDIKPEVASVDSNKTVEPKTEPNEREQIEGTVKQQETTSVTDSKTDADADLMEKIRTLALKLLATWDTLTEVFRIPKKLRIEQMKEHEREADLSYQAMEMSDDSDTKNQRFKSKSRWFEKSWDKDRNKYKDPNDFESHLTKMQRRQMFEAKVAQEREIEKQRSEEENEHNARCTFFRLDPRTTSRGCVPFCVDPTTGQWYSKYNQTVSTPPSHAHIKPPPKQLSTDPNDYDLPPMDLPDFWKFAIDNQGRLYYYHVKIRIPQWEPPIKLLPLMEEQQAKCENVDESRIIEGDGESIEDSTGIVATAASQDSQDEDDGIEDDNNSITSHDSSEEELENQLAQLRNTLNEKRMALVDSNIAEEISALASTADVESVESAISIPFNFDYSIDSVLLSKKKKRRIGLVQERIISPRTDEERMQLKLEVRRYKENKDKLRRRREEAKRRKMMAVNPLSKKVSKITEGLPVLQDDDLNTDDEDDTVVEQISEDSGLLADTVDVELPNKSSVNRIVDELDALKKDNRYGPPSKKVKVEVQHSKEVKPPQKPVKRKKPETVHPHINSEAAKRIKDKFRTEIAGVIVHHLSPYRKENCRAGRITNNDDFKHLAKKLTHFVMLKELKHCDNTITVLEVTDSVKQKSKEFIRKYMAKFGEIYTKPENEPEYKDFNSSTQ